VHHELTIY